MYGWIRPSALACGPKARPTSITSGACGPLLSLLALMASISSAEPASGFSSLTVISGYLALKPVDHVAIAAPVMRQGDGGQLAFRLGGGNEIFHRAGIEWAGKLGWKDNAAIVAAELLIFLLLFVKHAAYFLQIGDLSPPAMLQTFWIPTFVAPLLSVSIKGQNSELT